MGLCQDRRSVVKDVSHLITLLPINPPQASAVMGEQLNNSGPSALQASTIASSSLEPIITVPDQFSVFRQYDHPPRGPDPEEESVVQDQCETTEHKWVPSLLWRAMRFMLIYDK